jgi:hypothetical protein
MYLAYPTLLFMNTIERMHEYFLKSLDIYSTSIDKLIDQISMFYFEYPYLLVLLLALVPFCIFTIIYLLKKITSAISPETNLDNDYIALAFNFFGWILTSSIYENVYIALNKDFRAFEKILFALAASVASSYLVIIFFKALTLNAKDQFKSNLKEDTETLSKSFLRIKSMTQKYLIIILTLSIAFNLNTIGFWIFLLYLYKLNKELKIHDKLNESILNYLFQNIPRSISNQLIGPLRIVSLIYFLISALFYRVVFTLSYFDITKKLAAKIIRKQVERISSKSLKEVEIPKMYKDEFSSLQLNVYRPEWLLKIETSISDAITKWEENTNASSFSHLVGDPGSGRAILIEDIKSKHKELKPITIKVTNKITTAADFNRFIKEETEKIDVATKLIIFDNAENLYLNSPGQFDAIKKLFQTFSTHQERFYFINIFDYYPWLHIKDFFGQINDREVFTLKGFSDKELSKLILDKNKNSKTKIIFDKAIYEATNKKGLKNQEDNVSTYYFRMIWEQTSGNPLMAQLLWLNSIRSFNQQDQKIIVGLPQKKPSSIFKNISLNSMFVYNSILKHSRLNFEDCCTVTNLEPRIVSGALSFGKSSNFLSIDENNCYYIKRSWYTTLSELLKTKNLIYG